MAVIGRPYPFARQHDFLGPSGWPCCPAKSYTIVSVGYNFAWSFLPPATRLPVPIKLNPLPFTASGVLTYRSVIQVPIIRPAFFFQIDWKLFKRGVPQAPEEDTWRMVLSTTTGFAPLTTWISRNYACEGAGVVLAHFDILENRDTHTYQVDGAIITADHYAP